MISTIHRAALALICAAILVSPVMAADERATATRIPTITRLVKLFIEREGALAAAIRAGDAAKTQDFLSDDFEMRVGATPATPVPRADWVAEMMRLRNPGDDAREMAVHDLNGAAVVSFIQGSGQSAIFVVDVWRMAGAEWKLAIRYASAAGTAAFPIPGAAAAQNTIPKKY